MKSNHIAALIITAAFSVAAIGCANFQTSCKTSFQKAKEEIKQIDAWAKSPQGSAQIRATEAAAAKILATVAAFQGDTKTADYLNAAAAVSQAYAGRAVPVDVINDTIAAIPQIAPVVVPLVTNGPNTQKTVDLINALANDVRSSPNG